MTAPRERFWTPATTWVWIGTFAAAALCTGLMWLTEVAEWWQPIPMVLVLFIAARTIAWLADRRSEH